MTQKQKEEKRKKKKRNEKGIDAFEKMPNGQQLFLVSQLFNIDARGMILIYEASW